MKKINQFIMISLCGFLGVALFSTSAAGAGYSTNLARLEAAMGGSVNAKKNIQFAYGGRGSAASLSPSILVQSAIYNAALFDGSKVTTTSAFLHTNARDIAILKYVWHMNSKKALRMNERLLSMGVKYEQNMGITRPSKLARGAQSFEAQMIGHMDMLIPSNR